MTTASGPSASPGIRRSVALEQGEDRLELGPQVLDGLGGEGAARFRLELAGAAVLLDLLARPLDGVLLGVQQVLDQHDQLDLAPLVHAVARAVLGRIEEPELALPVAEHVRLQVRELADLADREELLDRLRRAHRHCSALRSRSIRSVMACLGDFPLKRISDTWRAMGSSTPWRSPSATAVRAVFTPSATLFFPARASSGDLPRPSSSPSVRLRDSAPVAVRIRSPIPASPANVRGSAPMRTPSRVISARPRVMSAARGLCPSPSPSTMPAATAITFLSAPPSSTPTTSVCVYTRKCPHENARCARRATPSCGAAATTAVGCPWCTSRANDGPESTAIAVPAGSSSLRTVNMVFESSSSPFDTLTTSAAGSSAGAAWRATARTANEGAAETTSSAPCTARRTSDSATSTGASGASGRNMGFAWSRLTLSTTSGSRAQRTTSSPLRASRSASAVPQAPPPNTATLMDTL